MWLQTKIRLSFWNDSTGWWQYSQSKTWSRAPDTSWAKSVQGLCRGWTVKIWAGSEVRQSHNLKFSFVFCIIWCVTEIRLSFGDDSTPSQHVQKIDSCIRVIVLPQQQIWPMGADQNYSCSSLAQSQGWVGWDKLAIYLQRKTTFSPAHAITICEQLYTVMTVLPVKTQIQHSVTTQAKCVQGLCRRLPVQVWVWSELWFSHNLSFSFVSDTMVMTVLPVSPTWSQLCSLCMKIRLSPLPLFEYLVLCQTETEESRLWKLPSVGWWQYSQSKLNFHLPTQVGPNVFRVCVECQQSRFGSHLSSQSLTISVWVLCFVKDSTQWWQYSQSKRHTRAPNTSGARYVQGVCRRPAVKIPDQLDLHFSQKCTFCAWCPNFALDLGDDSTPSQSVRVESCGSQNQN